MVRLEGLFEGWLIDEDEGKLWDSGGNDYDVNEIRAIHTFRQWQSGYFGRKGDIQSLKNQLERKIELVRVPEISVNWGDIEERYIHPHYRKKN
jgi:hypothetical protein